MIAVELPEQSSAADWEFSLQAIAEDDQIPLWSTVPGDLVVTMTVIPEGVSLSRDYGDQDAIANAAVLIAASNDSTGRLTAAIDGFVDVLIDDSAMADLAPDRYGISRRHLVFFKFQTAGKTMQALTAVLPVYRGA